MPRTPKYCQHKATGQAYVTINGRERYLGKFDSPASREEYDRVIIEWRRANDVAGKHTLTVGQLTLEYMEHCQQHYRKNGDVTSEVSAVKIALRHLNALFRTTLAPEFSPKKLKAVREAMIHAGYVRTSINRHVGRIRRMVRWAISEELADPAVLAALEAVSGLREGRSQAVESEPVKPVPQAFVDAIEGFVSRPVWGMVRFQLATGGRPGEVRIVRGCDLNMSGDIWEFTPGNHKTEHHGKSRIVFVGPRGQEVLTEFLKMDLREYLFSPRDVRRGRSGTHYSKFSYRQAIAKACDKANVPKWTPNQLRHNFATRSRREFGIEATRTVLGHSSAVTSEIYAEKDFNVARTVVAAIG